MTLVDKPQPNKPGAAADYIKKTLPANYATWDAAVVLGSGLSEGASAIEVVAELPYREVPGLSTTDVKGHKGVLSVGHPKNAPQVKVAVFQGRWHYYQSASMEQAALTARLAAAMGSKLLVLLSAVGATSFETAPGSFVGITDHLNLMGVNPLLGVTGEDGPPFVDLCDTYRKDIYEKVAGAQPELGLKTGVLAAFSGPTYETPVEVAMARSLGAALVGMSTVPEAVWAKYLGLEVAAYGLVTNPAAGVVNRELSHGEVLEVASSSAANAALLVEETLRQWIDNSVAGE